MKSDAASAITKREDKADAPANASVEPQSSASTHGERSLVTNRMFSGWDLKKQVLRPLIVNLLTAAIIGTWVWFFSANIRRWFFPPPSAADWPIHCLVEPVVNASPDAYLAADLYVINLEGNKHNATSLSALAEKAQTDAAMRPPVAITVRITSGPYRLLAIEPDIQFNEGKGKLSVSNDNPQQWTVRVEEIEKEAVLRARIKTDARRPITSKADLETMPLRVFYAHTSQ